ncbi:hypothetical protein [Dinghuibacter silviterrae]|uniref:Uncharacterized protein n=1 Tax=Dinghuibacter silviterrae TaxID=1539049 RepID=A0A4R8DG62_9BACT|nr:hypothetical protein [Dinghuibacter silviterrae]TDW95950.1 hypothetical protein EDB95_3771 [Dinghuibacter silviterrae]
MFSFHPDKFDFWPVYDCIKRFYPLGIPRGSLYKDYAGFKEAVALWESEIVNADRCEARWAPFVNEVTLGLGKPVFGRTYGQAPCYSIAVELERKVLENITRIRELQCFVSILGPFYTVIGIDRNEIQTGERHPVRSTNYMVVSPQHEYEDSFRKLCDIVEDRFKGYRFVPYRICTTAIEGLRVWYMDEDEPGNRIFHALFTYQIDFNIQTLGAETYGADAWIKEGYVQKGSWVANPPL